MIKLNERVTHNGHTYEPNEDISENDISDKEAQRLVDLDVAFFVEQDDVLTDEDIAKELEQAFHAGPLKEAAKQVGLEFPDDIYKKDLIQQIIDEEKEEDVLDLAEEEE